MKKDDLFNKGIEVLSQAILLDIPQECLEGVNRNAELLKKYSQLIHSFVVPQVKD
ncbi:DUF4089 domain-containing protein [Commensalibacter oyaizuii]|uniref:DUF4089 domain-containing protein n=1 Tax=Commensalibacter oyaizuii TaxID=3043873 RepID=A0ABT6PZN1_9PROT|nr:DUF4089 domain-containing protein [Commensalibacter sp. TBRC 16381]MDI2089966.1 DUF4089 domain-containing protein [Commensalibacter sp. TBRC 16381]